MPLDLNNLPGEDRAEFEKRLANYGLDTSSILANELITIASTITPLRMGADSKFRPIVLKTSDFDQVNKWIGLPDILFDRVPPLVDRPLPLRFPEMDLRRGRAELPSEDAIAKFSAKDLSSENLKTIRTAARAYLYGDSRKTKTFKSWIEKIFPVVDIPVWPFWSVTVKSGSVLEFGPGPHVLAAYNLTIEEGGIIRNYGELKVDVVILQKKTSTQYPFGAISPALSTIITSPVISPVRIMPR